MQDSVSVVIGANKGIGYALAEALHRAGHTVLATVRSTSRELQDLGVEIIEGVDITAENSTTRLQAALGSRKIGLLIVSAGAQQVDTLDTLTKECIREQMEVNAIGPLFAIKELQAFLKHTAKVVLITSKMGSITETEATGGELYGYRMSKVAINMAGKVLAIDLKRSKKSPVAIIHPGVVNTNMLRSLRKARGVADDKLTANTISQEESASKILGLVEELTLENSGTYWAADTGKVLGW